MASKSHLPQPTQDDAQAPLRLPLACDPSIVLLLENPTTIKNITNSILHRGTIHQSPWQSVPLPRPIRVVYKSYDHRAMYSLRECLAIPHWNTRRERIYRSLTEAEAQRRLSDLPDWETFEADIAGRYPLNDTGDEYLDLSAEEVSDELVADEELFVQRESLNLCETETSIYGWLRHEQGRCIPFCFEEVVAPALHDVAPSDSLHTQCLGLVLEEIQGNTLEDVLTTSAGQDVGPLVKQALVTLGISHCNKVVHGDIQLRNMLLCTRPYEERMQDAEAYGITLDPQKSHGEMSTVVFIDLEDAEIIDNIRAFRSSEQDLFNTFRDGFDAMGASSAMYAGINSYQDGRNGYCRYGDDECDTATLKVSDFLLSAACWATVGPLDSLEDHSTCYEISVRAWSIFRECNFGVNTFHGYVQPIADKQNRWVSAVRRMAVELFSDDPDEIECRFRSWLEATTIEPESEPVRISETDSETSDGEITWWTNPRDGTAYENYPAEFHDTSFDYLTSRNDVPIPKIFNNSKDTWRSIEGPPPLYLPAKDTASVASKLDHGSEDKSHIGSPQV